MIPHTGSFSTMPSATGAALLQAASQPLPPAVGRPFKRSEMVGCPGCKQRLRVPSLPQQAPCYALKCTGCGFMVTPQLCSKVTAGGGGGSAANTYALVTPFALVVDHNWLACLCAHLMSYYA